MLLLKNSFKSLILLLQILFGCAAYADPVTAGTVVVAAGLSERLGSTSSQPLNLKRGEEVYEGDLITTYEGTVIIKMVDNAIVAVPRMSQLKIISYKAETGIHFELLKGGVRTKTGEIGKSQPEKYRLDTPFAALGIRGTDYSVRLFTEGLGTYVHSGEVQVSLYDAQCVRASINRCDGANARSLSGSEGYWLRVLGDTMEQVPGVPDFSDEFDADDLDVESMIYTSSEELINPSDQLEYTLSIAGLKNLTPLVIESRPELAAEDVRLPIETLSEKLMLTGRDTDVDGLPDWTELRLGLNPWLSDTDRDGKDDSIDPSPLTADGYWWTDNSSVPLNDLQFAQTLSDLSLTARLYDLGKFGLVNTTYHFGDVGAISNWWDVTGGLFWGQRTSLETLLKMRQFEEGVPSWNRLAESFDQWELSGTQWVSSLASGDTDPFLLPGWRSAFAYSSTPTAFLPATTMRYNLLWVQPAPALGNFELQRSDSWSVGSVDLSPAGDVDIRLISSDKELTLRGKMAGDGVVWADDDAFSLRGVENNGTLVVSLHDKQAKTETTYGLGDSVVSASAEHTPGAVARDTGEISWGHWSNFDELSDRQIELMFGTTENVLHQERFAMRSDPFNDVSTLVGKANFKLDDSQALFMTGSLIHPANIENSYLNVNFDTDRFVTYMDVDAPVLSTPIPVWGGGSVAADGLLQGERAISNADFIGQVKPGAASLLFERDTNDGSKVMGITHWSR